MNEQPAASLALEMMKIPHHIFHHNQPVHSLEQAAVDRNQRPAQIVRSILFQIRDGEFVMVLMAGPDQIDWKKLRQLVKRSRIRMATEEEVLEVTGYQVGAVSPFGMKKQIRLMIDASVLAEEEVSIGSGIRNTAIIMKSADVQRVLGDVEVVSLADVTNSDAIQPS
jgi:Cys-tRNA(Pro)/Cys-tRNA(Cys) deacylase